jgi:hypothetical protein
VHVDVCVNVNVALFVGGLVSVWVGVGVGVDSIFLRYIFFYRGACWHFIGIQSLIKLFL